MKKEKTIAVVGILLIMAIQAGTEMRSNNDIITISDTDVDATDRPGEIRTPSLPYERAFIANEGQLSSDDIRFYTQQERISMLLSEGWFAYVVEGCVEDGRSSLSMVKVEFLGENPVVPIGLEEAEGD